MVRSIWPSALPTAGSGRGVRHRLAAGFARPRGKRCHPIRALVPLAGFAQPLRSPTLSPGQRPAVSFRPGATAVNSKKLAAMDPAASFRAPRSAGTSRTTSACSGSAFGAPLMLALDASVVFAVAVDFEPF